MAQIRRRQRDFYKPAAAIDQYTLCARGRPMSTSGIPGWLDVLLDRKIGEAARLSAMYQQNTPDSVNWCCKELFADNHDEAKLFFSVFAGHTLWIELRHAAFLRLFERASELRFYNRGMPPSKEPPTSSQVAVRKGSTLMSNTFLYPLATFMCVLCDVLYAYATGAAPRPTVAIVELPLLVLRAFLLKRPVNNQTPSHEVQHFLRDRVLAPTDAFYGFFGDVHRSTMHDEMNLALLLANEECYALGLDNVPVISVLAESGAMSQTPERIMLTAYYAMLMRLGHHVQQLADAKFSTASVSMLLFPTLLQFVNGEPISDEQHAFLLHLDQRSPGATADMAELAGELRTFVRMRNVEHPARLPRRHALQMLYATTEHLGVMAVLLHHVFDKQLPSLEPGSPLLRYEPTTLDMPVSVAQQLVQLKGDALFGEAAALGSWLEGVSEAYRAARITGEAHQLVVVHVANARLHEVRSTVQFFAKHNPLLAMDRFGAAYSGVDAKGVYLVADQRLLVMLRYAMAMTMMEPDRRDPVVPMYGIAALMYFARTLTYGPSGTAGYVPMCDAPYRADLPPDADSFRLQCYVTWLADSLRVPQGQPRAAMVLGAKSQLFVVYRFVHVLANVLRRSMRMRTGDRAAEIDADWTAINVMRSFVMLGAPHVVSMSTVRLLHKHTADDELRQVLQAIIEVHGKSEGPVALALSRTVAQQLAKDHPRHTALRLKQSASPAEYRAYITWLFFAELLPTEVPYTEDERYTMLADVQNCDNQLHPEPITAVSYAQPRATRGKRHDDSPQARLNWSGSLGWLLDDQAALPAGHRVPSDYMLDGISALVTLMQRLEYLYVHGVPLRPVTPEEMAGLPLGGLAPSAPDADAAPEEPPAAPHDDDPTTEETAPEEVDGAPPAVIKVKPPKPLVHEDKRTLSLAVARVHKKLVDFDNFFLIVSPTSMFLPEKQVHPSISDAAHGTIDMVLHYGPRIAALAIRCGTDDDYEPLKRLEHYRLTRPPLPLPQPPTPLRVEDIQAYYARLP
jgi:hypothetical protein